MTETMLEVYGDDRFGRAYGYRSTIYATGWHRGQDIRKQNAAKTASVISDVLALHDGVVHSVTRKAKIGLTIVIKTKRPLGTGVYEFHSHLRDAAVKTGDSVKRGELIARTETRKYLAGSSWGGTHDHVVFSDFADGSWNINRVVVDPRPIIRASRSYVAPSKPAPAGSKKVTQLVLAPLNLRQDPVANSKRLLTIPKSASVVTTPVGNGWSKVTYKGKTGYASDKFMIPRYATVNARVGLNLRKTAATNGKVLAVIPNGEEIVLRGVPGKDDTSKWRLVTFGGQRGWVHRDYLKY